MGGMRALEWAATEPDRVARLFLLASPAVGVGGPDRLGGAAARGDPRRPRTGAAGDYHDAPPGQGPHVGLGIARRMAHLSYRSPYELAQRFGRLAQPGEDPARGGRYAVESYLDHHADKLVHRFDAASYVRLTEMMNAHDVGRGRGGVPSGLARVTARDAGGGRVLRPAVPAGAAGGAGRRASPARASCR